MGPLAVIFIVGMVLGPKEQWTSPNGITVTFVSAGHKHADKAEDSIGIWAFRFEKAGAKPVVSEVRGRMAEAEIAAHGQLFRVGQSKVAGRLRVTEEALGPKLSEDAALALAEKLAKELDHQGSRMHEDNGIYVITFYRADVDLLRVRIGAYTRRTLELTKSPSP